MYWHFNDAPDPFFWWGLIGQLVWMWCCLGVCISLQWYRKHNLACGLLAALAIASGALATWINYLMFKLDTPGVALYHWREHPVQQAYLWHWGRLAVLCGGIVAVLMMLLFVLPSVRRARLSFVGIGFGAMYAQFVAYFGQQLLIVHYIDATYYTLPNLGHKGVFYAGLLLLAAGTYRAIRASEAKKPILRLWRMVARTLFAVHVRT